MTTKEKNRRLGIITKIKAKNFNNYKFCTTPNCINTTFANCHLIPSANQLSHIEEDFKVSWINPKPADIFFKGMKIDWRKTEIARVLTFYGFCANCDNNIFKQIDRPIKLDPEEMPLLAYRAYSYLYWYERFEGVTIKDICDEFNISLEDIPSIRQKDPRVAKNRKEEIEYEEQSNQFILATLRDMIAGKNSDLRSHILVLDKKSELLFSCATPLTIGPYMNIVKIDWSTSTEPPKLYVHLLNSQNNGCLIFSWEKKFDEFAIPLIKTFKAIPSNELGMTFLAYAAFNNMGLAIKTSLLESIPIDIRLRITKEVEKRHKTGVISNGFYKKINSYNMDDWNIIDEVKL